jgi:hypothetical protein
MAGEGVAAGGDSSVSAASAVSAIRPRFCPRFCPRLVAAFGVSAASATGMGSLAVPALASAT